METIDASSPLSTFGLSTRILNGLARYWPTPITMVGQLTACHGWDILDIHRVAPGAYGEVVAALAKHSLELKPTPCDWPPLPKVDGLDPARR